MTRKEEITKKLEEIFENSFSVNSAWEKIKELAEREGKEEVYKILLENLIDDLTENEEQVKEFLKIIGWEIE